MSNLDFLWKSGNLFSKATGHLQIADASYGAHGKISLAYYTILYYTYSMYMSI